MCCPAQALCQEADRTFKRSVKEDHDFAEFQQQREKLNYFWIVEKKNLENKRALLRNKERELQDLEEKQQVEIKIYKQRVRAFLCTSALPTVRSAYALPQVKHLLHEHQNDITLNKTEAQASLKVAQDEHRSDQAHLKVRLISIVPARPHLITTNKHLLFLIGSGRSESHCSAIKGG
jgi:hypothetical protein